MLHVLSLLEMHLYLFPLIQMSVSTTPPLPLSLSLPEYNFKLSPSVSQTRLTFKLLCPLRYKLLKIWNYINVVESNFIFRGRHVTVTTLATRAFIVIKVGKSIYVRKTASSYKFCVLYLLSLLPSAVCSRPFLFAWQ